MNKLVGELKELSYLLLKEKDQDEKLNLFKRINLTIEEIDKKIKEIK